MRLVRMIAAVYALSMSAPAFGQPPSPQASASQGEWIVYVDRAERFTINFPGQPTISQRMYEPQRGPMVPARIYTVQDGPRRYMVTVVNYAGANVNDVPHAVAWEAWNYRKRGGEVTYDSFANVDRINGHQLHITNADKTVTIVGIYLHARRLYILEARVPPSTPGALHFQQSLQILDEQGKRIRYNVDENGDRSTRANTSDVY